MGRVLGSLTGCCVALLLALQGCKIDTDTTPHGCVRMFLQFVARGKCDDAWRLFTPRRQGLIEEEVKRFGARAGISRAQEFYCRARQGNPYPNLVPTSVQLSGTSTDVQADVWVDQQDGRGKWFVTVVKEGTSWRVDGARPAD